MAKDNDIDNELLQKEEKNQDLESAKGVVESKAKDEIEKAARSEMEKAATNSKGITEFFALLAENIYVVLIAIAVIIILIAFVGIISYIISAPGNITGEIKSWFVNTWKNIEETVVGKPQVKKEDVISVAQYINDMGYDLKGFGFADPKYDESSKIIQSADWKNGKLMATVTEKILDLYEGDDNRKYLQAYLAANEETYMKSTDSIAGWFNAFKTGSFNPKESSSGLLQFDDGYNFILFAGNYPWRFHIETNSSLEQKVEIDREKQLMTIYEKSISPLNWIQGSIKFGSEFKYDLSNWTAQYGRPLELFLSLHLATMSPDLTYAIATDSKFNTKVEIAGTESEITFTYVATKNGKTYTSDYIKALGKKYGEYLVELDRVQRAQAEENKRAAAANEQPEQYSVPSNPLSGTGLNETELDSLYALQQYGDYNNNNDAFKKKVKIPYIKSIKNHWFYKDYNFEKVYKRVKAVTKTINYEPEEASLQNFDIKLKARFTSENGIPVQVTEAEMEPSNENIIALFQDKYYRYDGTRATAELIEQARKNGDESLKQPVKFNDTTETLQAFSILENIHNEASDEVYRCLKQLVIDLNYFEEDDISNQLKNVLVWPFEIGEDKKGKGTVERDTNKYGIKIKDVNGLDFRAPGDGKVISRDGDTITVKFEELDDYTLKILKNKFGYLYSFTNADKTVDDMTMTIKGLKNITLGKGNDIIRGETVIGQASDSVEIMFYNLDKTLVEDVEQYMNREYTYEYEEGFRKNLENQIALQDKVNGGRVTEVTVGTTDDDFNSDDSRNDSYHGEFKSVTDPDELQTLTKMVEGFEGISGPSNNQDTYTMVLTEGGSNQTIGPGITQMTIDTWFELGYGKYFVLAEGNEPYKVKHGDNYYVLTSDPIPVEVVNKVKMKLLDNKMVKLEQELKAKGIVDWSSNQKIALCSFIYNTGNDHGFIDKWASGDFAGARRSMLSVITSKGKVLKGLAKRRAVEWIYFRTGINYDPIMSIDQKIKMCYQDTNSYKILEEDKIPQG